MWSRFCSISQRYGTVCATDFRLHCQISKSKLNLINIVHNILLNIMVCMCACVSEFVSTVYYAL